MKIFASCLIALSVLSLSAKMQRGRVQFEESEALSQSGNTICFPVCVEQKSGDYLVIEGEDFFRYAPTKKDCRLLNSPNYSNSGAVVNARELIYDFAIATPGEYQVWIRAFFPRQANYNHSEFMDDGETRVISDSTDHHKISKTAKSGATTQVVLDNFLPSNTWHWTPNFSYTLDKGSHRWTWTSPSAWCGGCILDKIVMIRKGSNVEPESAGTENRIVYRPKQGTLTSRRIRTERIAAWLFEYAAEPGDGSITVEYSYDKEHFLPLKSGEQHKIKHGQGEYLWIRIRMSNAPYGKQIPVIYHYDFKFEKKR